MLSEHYAVQAASESGVMITCLSGAEKSFVMVSNAVIEHRIGCGLMNATQKRRHVMDHTVEFLTIAESKRMRFKPSSDVIWILVRDMSAPRKR